MSDKPVFSKEVPQLLVSHLEHLQQSAISLEVIKERGYRSVIKVVGKSYDKKKKAWFYDETEPGEVGLGQYGFSQMQLIAPSILMPMYGPDGEVVLHQLRPDEPRINKGSGKPIKYETPKRRSLRVDIPPRCLKDIKRPEVPLFITEGVKKGDALATAGACVLTLPGVWGWRGTDEETGGKYVLPEFDQIAWNGRTVYIIFDSDIVDKDQVKHAMERLSALLKQKGALVKVVRLPPGEKGAKTGADDFLHQGHTLEDIVQLADRAPVKEEKPEGGVFSKNLPDIHDGTMYAKTFNEDGQVRNIFPLTNFSAKVAAVVTRDDGQVQTKLFRVIGRCEDGSMLTPVDVPAKDFDSLSWITPAWDMQAVMSPRSSAQSEVRHRMKLASRDAKRITEYTHTGWREINGRPVYLTQGGAIGDPNVVVDLQDSHLTDYRLPAWESPLDDNGKMKPKIKEAMRLSLDFLDMGERSVTLPLWAAMHLAPLNPIIDTCFTVFVMGDSGTFKSSITSLALNHYGAAWNFRHFPASWVSTENWLESQMYYAKDAPFVIDDFAPGANNLQSQILEARAERIIRNQGDRTGRGRLTKDMTSRVTLIPRGLLMTSGEHLPGGHSRNARIFVVIVEKGDIDLDRLLNVSDEQRGLYSVAMTQYIGYLARRWDELKRELPKQTTSWLRQVQATKKADGHPRQDDAVAKLYAATTVGLEYHVQCGILSRKEAGILAGDAMDIFLQWSAKQGERVEDLSPGKLFLSAFMSLLSAGKLSFTSVNDIEDPVLKPGQTKIGWFDADKNFLLIPDMAYSVVRTFCATTDNPLTSPALAVWRDLKRRGLSECHENRNNFVVKIHGDITQVIKLPRGNVLSEVE